MRTLLTTVKSGQLFGPVIGSTHQLDHKAHKLRENRAGRNPRRPMR